MLTTAPKSGPVLATSVTKRDASTERLYNGPSGDTDFELVRQFVLDTEARQPQFTESQTFETKERHQGNNVDEAVTAIGNSDGGIVLVGVTDKGVAGRHRIVGVPAPA